MRHEWNESQMTGPLDGYPQCPLMLGADPGATPRLDLGAVRDEPADLVHILVVNDFDVFHAEGADPPPGYEASPGTSSRAPSRPWAARTSAGSPSLWSGRS